MVRYKGDKGLRSSKVSARKTDLAAGGESSQWRSCPTFACCVVGRGVGARASLRGPPISTSDRTSSPLRSSTAWPLFNEKKICEGPVAAISLSLTAAMQQAQRCRELSLLLPQRANSSRAAAVWRLQHSLPNLRMGSFGLKASGKSPR